MTDEQPTQPLTGCELDDIEGRWLRYVALRDPDSMETSVHDVPDLLAEVDRLRAENHGVTDENSALLRKLEEQYRRRAQSVNEITRIRNEATGTALGHLAKIKRLQSERDALVRKLGLDWGPDEFGDLDAVPMEGSFDRGEMLSDLQWYITDLGPEHWQNCDVGDEDCYLCAGHVAIRGRWKGVE